MLAGCERGLSSAERIQPAAVEAWQASAYRPSDVEALEHRHGDLFPIVVGKQPGRYIGRHSALPVATGVAPDGRVTEARLIDYPDSKVRIRTPAIDRQAVEAVKALRFRPFSREGRPVAAKLVIFVPMLESPAPLPNERSFPVGDPKDAAIELTRTQCLGSCPAYKVVIRGDGEVVWQGDRFVVTKGEARARIAPEAVASLIQRARDTAFFDLGDAYRLGGATDGVKTTVTFTHGGKTKTVTDDFGVEAGMPYEVVLLQQAIDRAAGTARWIGDDEARREQ